MDESCICVYNMTKLILNIMFCTDGKISVRINLPLFSTVVPSNICMFLSCRPFVVITTFSTGLVGVEVTTGQKHTRTYIRWKDGGK